MKLAITVAWAGGNGTEEPLAGGPFIQGALSHKSPIFGLKAASTTLGGGAWNPVRIRPVTEPQPARPRLSEVSENPFRDFPVSGFELMALLARIGSTRVVRPLATKDCDRSN